MNTLEEQIAYLDTEYQAIEIARTAIYRKRKTCDLTNTQVYKDLDQRSADLFNQRCRLKSLQAGRNREGISGRSAE